MVDLKDMRINTNVFLLSALHPVVFRRLVMFAGFCFGLLALSSLSAASEATCEELLVPVDDLDLVVGKWIYYAGTSDNKDYLNKLQTISSTWMDVTPVANTDNVTLTWGDKVAGKCIFEINTSTYSNLSATVEFHYSSSNETHHERYLKTCPDCLLLFENVTMKSLHLNPIEGRFLILLTKSGRRDDAQLEVFKKQAACLNFQEELHFGESTDLCPEVTVPQENQQ
ncbi:uncharacterized protein LOC133475330 isoform X2 [Phyllopteryx taeniolatus]|uniref:uncharacterized protein LOC133475330 isoform X2 n=1 Tax=Phyllopteryx taeniolatus TaxID=161469 RepID=UPI002AD4D0D6|nr:uncharacterized protein LOC133475330 isoform X2 [Phyllopteryx taeniolatus]